MLLRNLGFLFFEIILEILSDMSNISGIKD